MVSVRINCEQASLNSAYRPEMPNRAEIRGTVGAEFSAHAFQSFSLIVISFAYGVVVCDDVGLL
jgi:hypothetical protein